MNVTDPLPAASPRERKQDTEADVIVVGGGGSGLAAAIEARAVVRNVLLLEKNLELGGSTAWSIGSVTASGTPHQARKGIVDTTEDHWRDMAGLNGGMRRRSYSTISIDVQHYEK